MVDLVKIRKKAKAEGRKHKAEVPPAEPVIPPPEPEAPPTQDSALSTQHSPAIPNLRLAIVSDPLSQQGSELQADAPACDVCGSITVRSGTCYKCLNCGNSMGCS